MDSNADNMLSPVDALLVINALNDGEGLDKLMGFSMQLENNQGEKIEPVNDPLGNPVLRESR